MIFDEEEREVKKDKHDASESSDGEGGRRPAKRRNTLTQNMRKLRMVRKMIGMAHSFSATEIKHIPSLRDLVHALLDSSKFVSVEEFDACMRRQCAELIFFVGDVKGALGDESRW